eukprot:GHVH01005962.1.p1 GENE.GHVH01005962.1~~GHVH01005962.1.p1  ORF type:complete len:750 (-),score=86.66 GHVH01005962.1:103-2352(-)
MVSERRNNNAGASRPLLAARGNTEANRGIPTRCAASESSRRPAGRVARNNENQSPVRAINKRFTQRPPVAAEDRGDHRTGRNHLKRPGPLTNRGTRKIAKGNVPGSLTPPDGPDDGSRPCVVTPTRGIRPSPTRPGTPDSVRSYDFEGSAVVNSPISRAKRNAKVPQLYLSAGNTPPPGQVYRTKKRIQKRILVLSGGVGEEKCVTSDTILDTEEPLNRIFRLPPAPSVKEMGHPVDEDVITDILTEVEPTDNGEKDSPGKVDEDMEFLIQRHKPVSEAYHCSLKEGSDNHIRRLSLDDVKQNIKHSLTQPLGTEASLIGEILSRDTADLHDEELVTDSPPSSFRRASAPVSRSPLSSWSHTRKQLASFRRVSEGSASADRPDVVNLTPKVVPLGVKKEDASTRTETEEVVSESMKKSLNHTPLSETRSESSPASSAPFEELTDVHETEAPRIKTSQRLSRTLDEPEDCYYSHIQSHKSSRRRSISEPRGRTGGPGGTVGAAIQEAYTNAYFTLNPSIFEDSRVWGITEFRKLCQMLNVDTSLCREFQDYVNLLHEWNHKPDVNIGMNSGPVSSTYHAGDIRAPSLGNFHNVPILACKVPLVYRRLIEPLEENFVLASCMKDAVNGDRPNLHFSPYNHNCQFYLSAEERYEKRLCLHEIASMASISNEHEGVDAQIILLDPTRELNGDPDWEEAKANMNRNLIITNPRYHLDANLNPTGLHEVMTNDIMKLDHSLKVTQICNSQDVQEW